MKIGELIQNWIIIQNILATLEIKIDIIIWKNLFSLLYIEIVVL